MSADHLSIDGNSPAGSNYHNLPRKNCPRGHIDNLAVAHHACDLRQKVQHVLDGAPPPADGEPLQNLGRQHKRGNHQRREELADRQRRNQRDGHGEFHRHAALDKVLERLLKDWVAADQGGYQPDHAYPMKRLPPVKPHCRRGKRYKSDAHNVRHFKAMLMALLVFISALVAHRVDVRVMSMLKLVVVSMFVPVFRFDFRVFVSERHIVSRLHRLSKLN